MQSLRAAGAAIAAAALLWSLSAHADDPKPVVVVKNRNIEATLIVDPALKAEPALYDGLLADGRRELDKWRKSADEDRKSSPEVFTDGRKYAFDRKYMQRSALTRYVSVVYTDYNYSGGAHPNHDTDTILWDKQAKKRVNIRPFFKESAKDGPAMKTLSAAIRTALYAEKKERGVEDAEKDTGPQAVTADILHLGAIALVPSTEAGKSAGFGVYFPPYAVGPYAEGDYFVFIPWTVFKDHLSADGTAVFGGTRVAGDEAKD